MQRVEVIAARLENPRVDFLGAREIALPVQGHRLRECLREVRGLGHGRTIEPGRRGWLGPIGCAGCGGNFCTGGAVC